MINPREPDDEDNNEQREPDQAQDVADDALMPDDTASPLDSSKPDGGITDDDSDVHDTVDMMKQMVTSGHIDMGAYAGEPLMDDGDETMPGTPAGPMPGSDDDVMGILAEQVEEIEDSGADPLASMVSNDARDENQSDS